MGFAMPKCTVTFLLNAPIHTRTETWELRDHNSGTLMARLKRIAAARLPLLANTVKIVRLEAKGEPSERVEMKGSGGTNEIMRHGIRVLNNSYTGQGVTLVGIPKDLFFEGSLLPAPKRALATLAQVLRECGAVLIRRGAPMEIGELVYYRTVLLTNPKPVRKGKLVDVLGKEKGEAVWDEVKQRKSRIGGP